MLHGTGRFGQYTWEDLGETPEEHDYTDECMECGHRTEACTPCEREYKPDYRRRTTRYVCEACWPDHVAECDECREAHE